MRALVLALAAITAFATDVLAQPASPHPEAELALGREVVDLAGTREVMEAQMRVMAPQLAAQIVATGRSQAFADRYVAVFMEEFANDWPRIRELGAISYASVFTEAELMDIRAFYQSPAGRRFVAEAPALTDAMSRAGMLLGIEAGQRAMARLERESAPGTLNP